MRQIVAFVIIARRSFVDQIIVYEGNFVTNICFLQDVTLTQYTYSSVFLIQGLHSQKFCLCELQWLLPIIQGYRKLNFVDSIQWLALIVYMSSFTVSDMFINILSNYTIVAFSLKTKLLYNVSLPLSPALGTLLLVSYFAHPWYESLF